MQRRYLMAAGAIAVIFTPACASADQATDRQPLVQLAYNVTYRGALWTTTQHFPICRFQTVCPDRSRPSVCYQVKSCI
jgi:hypothetical protein